MRGSFNPLPAEKVGENLLFDLRAESIIRQLRLPKDWEDSSAPDFNEIRAIVMRVFRGRSESEADFTELAFSARDPLTAKRVRSKAEKLSAITSDPKTEQGSLGIQERLMLGFGHEISPSQIDSRLSESDWFTQYLCKCSNLPAGAITARQVESAKRSVMKLYKLHSENQKRRAASRNGGWKAWESLGAHHPSSSVDDQEDIRLKRLIARHLLFRKK